MSSTLTGEAASKYNLALLTLSPHSLKDCDRTDVADVADASECPCVGAENDPLSCNSSLCS